MAEELRERVVLIGGATGPLGSAFARAFAETEAQLVLTSTSQERAEELADELGLAAGRVFPKAFDATDPASVDDLVSQALERFGGLHVLLNTVGGWGGGKTVDETPVDQWEKILARNLRSAFLISRAVLPHMLEFGWGRVIHTSSKTAVSPRRKNGAYAVAKMGVITLTEVIAAEVKDTGVTANVVLPSIVDTPDNRRAMSSADTSKWVPPQHIAATVRFLCSEEAASINGARIPMYGGV